MRPAEGKRNPSEAASNASPAPRPTAPPGSGSTAWGPFTTTRRRPSSAAACVHAIVPARSVVGASSPNDSASVTTAALVPTMIRIESQHGNAWSPIATVSGPRWRSRPTSIEW